MQWQWDAQTTRPHSHLQNAQSSILGSVDFTHTWSLCCSLYLIPQFHQLYSSVIYFRNSCFEQSPLAHLLWLTGQTHWPSPVDSHSHVPWLLRACSSLPQRAFWVSASSSPKGPDKTGRERRGKGNKYEHLFNKQVIWGRYLTWYLKHWLKCLHRTSEDLLFDPSLGISLLLPANTDPGRQC